MYVANPGYLLSKSAIPRGAVITEFAGKPVNSINDFARALDQLADGSRAQLRFVTMDSPQNSSVRSFEMDRVWFPVRRCKRDDKTGIWPCVELGPGPAPAPPPSGSTALTSYEDPRVAAIAPSLVVVTFDLPYTVSGVADRHYYGTGLVVDKERGLVLVDRNTVPVAIGDVTVTFAGSLEVDAKVEQLHPLHNLAIVSYDPKSIGDTPVREAKFNTVPLQAGDKTWIVGIKGDHQLVHQESTVSAVEPLILPLSRTLRFRDSNIEGIDLVNGRPMSMACWSTSAAASPHCGRVSPSTRAVRRGSSIAALALTWSPSLSISCATGGRTIRSKRSSSTRRCLPPATSVWTKSGSRSSRPITRFIVAP